MAFNEFLADLILYLHFLYVLGVIVPIPLIVLGAWLHWSWVRQVWLRRIHAGMILFVAFESLIGWICPLTDWEASLRAQTSKDAVYPQGFIAAWVSRILFSDFEAWVYTLLYLLTALVVLDLYILIPPKKL